MSENLPQARDQGSGLFAQLAQLHLPFDDSVPNRIGGLRPVLPYDFDSFKANEDGPEAEPLASTASIEAAESPQQRHRTLVPDIPFPPLAEVAPSPSGIPILASVATTPPPMSSAPIVRNIDANDSVRAQLVAPHDEYVSHHATTPDDSFTQARPQVAELRQSLNAKANDKRIMPKLAATSRKSAAPKPLPLQPRLPQDVLDSKPVVAQKQSEPTIEIHIGRVEVKAHVTPPAQQQRSRPAAADQRLASYLRHRNQGARS